MRATRAAVAAIICLTLTACWSRDERAVIRQRLDAFADAVNKGGGSGLAGAAAHAISLAEFFTNPAPVDRQLYKRFRQWLRDNNQLNGSVWSRLHDDPARLLSRR